MSEFTEFLNSIQDLQPQLKIIAFLCLSAWGILRTVKGIINASSEFLYLITKLKNKKDEKEGNSPNIN